MPNTSSISASSCLDAANKLISSGDINSGLILAERALSLSKSTDTTEHALSLISVHGYYSEDADMKRLGMQSCERLFTGREFSSHARGWAMRNSVWYAPMLDEKFGNVRFKRIEIEKDTNWSLFNPSICTHNGKIYVIQRVANYVITPEGYYIIQDEGVVKTKNFLVEMSESLEVISSREIKYPTSFDTPLCGRILGLEDCRVFVWNDQLWVSATSLQLNAEGVCEIHIARIEDVGGSLSFTDVQKITPADVPFQHEKNWMPFVKDGNLFWIYRSDPTRVIDRTGRTVRLSTPGICAETFSGGSQLVWTPRGWLALIHHSVDGVLRKRAYLHRFVLFDENLNLAAYSPPFFFRHKGVEFVCGLALLDGDRLVVGFGVDDSESWLAELSFSTVMKGLVSAPAPKNCVTIADHDWIFSGINTAMKSPDDFKKSKRITLDIGLKLHEDDHKNWDTLQAFWAVLKTNEKNALIVDIGATTESSFLQNLRRMGFQNLIGANLDVETPFMHDGVRYQYGDCTAMDFPEGSVNFINCQSVIEHGVNVKAFLSESARVLKPGGHLFVSTDYWCEDVDTKGQEAFGVPVKVFTRDEIEALIRMARDVGLVPTSPPDLTCKDKTVSWIGMDYTFVSLMFKKVEG